MNKFELSNKIKTAKPQIKEVFIQEACRGKRVLDMGCIRHSAEFAISDPNWLHKKIKTVAKEVIGVDYLQTEIEKLQTIGYKIVFGDVTKPLYIDGKFDIIVAGDLIEHLSNFEGFFNNCTQYLNHDGIIIITTPNPFYAEEVHYVAFKNNYLINPEHTCWIDPQALSQLGNRFGYQIDELYFIRNSWKLKNLICETVHHEYDIINGRWKNNTLTFKIIRKAMGIIFNTFYIPFKISTGMHSNLVRYSDYLAVLKKTDAILYQ